MEDTLTIIRKRRSIRKFTDQPVEREKIQLLLESAMAAPSAMNALMLSQGGSASGGSVRGRVATQETSAAATSAAPSAARVRWARGAQKVRMVEGFIVDSSRGTKAVLYTPAR